MSSDKYQYVNIEAINDIADGDPEFIKEIIGNYFNTVSNSIQGLEEAIKEPDTEKIIFFAHKLKGSFGFIGADTLTRMAIDIETNATDTEALQSKIADLINLSELVETELKAIMNTLKPL
jgi:HPt (histidine-containing phosphotransfer) domain-containing protein